MDNGESNKRSGDERIPIVEDRTILRCLRSSLDSLRETMKDRLILNSGYLLCITIVGALVGFFFWMIVARIYPPEEVGIASSVISIVLLLAGISNLGLGIGLVRFLSERHDPEDMLNTSFSLTLMVSVLVGGVYLMGIEHWSPTLRGLFTGISNMGGFLAFLVAANVGTLLQMAYLGYRQVRYAFWQVVIMNFLRLVLVVTLARRWTTGIIASVAISWAIADGVGVFAFLPKVVKGFRVRGRWSTDVVRLLIPYSFGNYAADMLYRSPMLLAAPFALERLGATSSAYAYIAWMIGSLLASPGLALAQSAFAEGSHAPADLRTILLRAGLYAGVVTIPLALIGGMGATSVLGIFGESYATEAASYLRWLSAAAPLTVFVGLYFSALRVQRKVGELLTLSGLVVGISIAIFFLAIDEFGLTSIGMGWFAAQAIVVVVVSGHLILGGGTTDMVKV